MSVHIYLPDPDLTDWAGARPCSTCGMPKQHHSHDLPETPDEAREIDARILGEGTEVVQAAAERVRLEIQNTSDKDQRR